MKFCDIMLWGVVRPQRDLFSDLLCCSGVVGL